MGLGRLALVSRNSGCVYLGRHLLEGASKKSAAYIKKGFWLSRIDKAICIISSMRRSVSSPDETPGRELKIRRAAE